MANTANIKAVITAEDRASGVLHGFSNSVDKLGTNIASTMKQATKYFGLAAVAATGFAVKSAADFEQTRIGLENMLGSADAARAMLAKVSRFAAETPFEFPELAQATRQLVAFGFSGEDAFKAMTQLGDVSAAIGAPISDLAYLMGTLKAQGRAFTIDIRQFAMRGIPIYEYLAKVLETDTEKLTELIETGKVGFPEVQKAFELMTAEGGKFHGTMAKQSKSLSGLFSTLRDSIGQTARQLVGINQEGDVRQGSIFDRLRISAASLIEWLDKNKENITKRVEEIVTTMLRGAEEFGRKFVDNVKSQGFSRAVGDALKEMLANIDWAGWAVAAIALMVSVAPDIILGLGRGIFEAARNNPLDFAVLFALLGFVPGLGVVLAGVLAGIPIIGTIAGWIIGAFTSAATLVAAPILNVFKGIATSAIGAIATKFSSLAALIGTPLIMPALVVAAALASLKTVWDMTQSILKAVDAINGAQLASQAASNQQGYIIKSAKEAYAAGRISEARMKSIIEGSAVPSMKATGGPVSGGTPYIVGEKGPELFVPNRSGSIIPNDKMSGTVNINVNVGMYAGTEMEKRKMAEELMRAFKDVAASKNMAWGM